MTVCLGREEKERLVEEQREELKRVKELHTENMDRVQVRGMEHRDLPPILCSLWKPTNATVFLVLKGGGVR
jgi:hypothetical protein